MSTSRHFGATAPKNHPFVSDTKILDYQEADRRWFERHPTRQYRFRKPYVAEPFVPPGEVIPPVPTGWHVHILVAQIKPGIRTRTRVVHLFMPPASMMNSDAWISDLFKHCFSVAFAQTQEIARIVARKNGEAQP